jgi:hypothetical protein
MNQKIMEGNKLRATFGGIRDRQTAPALKKFPVGNNLAE